MSFNCEDVSGSRGTGPRIPDMSSKNQAHEANLPHYIKIFILLS